ncbi:hypothetical protein B0H21DRAFT_889567 [Amylocystis lapponica]|nr:hypothetical protein B0H21DRAFT_889567 [Amylocystis lapponica]
MFDFNLSESTSTLDYPILEGESLFELRPEDFNPIFDDSEGDISFLNSIVDPPRPATPTPRITSLELPIASSTKVAPSTSSADTDGDSTLFARPSVARSITKAPLPFQPPLLSDTPPRSPVANSLSSTLINSLPETEYFTVAPCGLPETDYSPAATYAPVATPAYMPSPLWWTSLPHTYIAPAPIVPFGFVPPAVASSSAGFSAPAWHLVPPPVTPGPHGYYVQGMSGEFFVNPYPAWPPQYPAYVYVDGHTPTFQHPAYAAGPPLGSLVNGAGSVAPNAWEAMASPTPPTPEASTKKCLTPVLREGLKPDAPNGLYRCRLGDCTGATEPDPGSWRCHLTTSLNHFPTGTLPEDAPPGTRSYIPEDVVSCDWPTRKKRGREVVPCQAQMPLGSMARHVATVHVRGAIFLCPTEGCDYDNPRKDLVDRHIKCHHDRHS